MDTREGIAANTGVSMVTRTLGLVLAFFSLSLVTRGLGPDKAGEYFTILAYGGIFNVLADLGLYQTLLRDMSRPGADDADIFSKFFSLRVVSLLLVLGVAAPLIALLFPYSASVKIGIAVGSFTFVCSSLITFFIAVFQKYLRMRVVAIGEFASRIVQVLLTLWLLQAGYGVIGALFAMLGAGVVHLAVVAFYARRHIPYRFTPDLGAWKTILRVSYPIALSTIFSFIYFKIDSLMLSLLKPSYDVGVYGLAYKILETIVAYPPIYVGLLVPVFVRYASESREKFFHTVHQAFDALSFIAFPMLAGGLVLAPKLIALFGKGYDDSVRTLMILLGATFAIFFGTLYSNMLIVIHKQKTLAYIYFLGMILNVGVNFYAIPRWSYIGAAWTTLATEVGVTIAMVLLLKKYDWFSAALTRTPRIALASALMVFVLFLFSSHSILTLLLIGVASYGAFAFLLKAVSISEIKGLVRPS